MFLEGLEISDLRPVEVRPEHLPRMRPLLAIGGENARTEEGGEGTDAALAKTPFLEVEGLNGFEVVRLNGHDHF